MSKVLNALGVKEIVADAIIWKWDDTGENIGMLIDNELIIFYSSAPQGIIDAIEMRCEEIKEKGNN